MSEYVLSWHDPQRLATELRALPALDNAAVAEAQGDFLIDACVPGAPLLITFAFVDWAKTAEFYLFGRSKKLEAWSGKPINRILLRDRRNLWYLQGVEGLGGSVAEVVKKLQLLIAAMQPGALWCIGESMGGYAAILHGLLLQAERIVAFGTLSTFDAAFAEQYGDRRWLGVMKGLNPALVEASDLPTLARRQQYRGRLHLIQGTFAGHDASDTHDAAVNLDVMHSRRFADLRSARVHDYPLADHAVTLWLKDHDQFDAILQHCLFDARDTAFDSELQPAPAAPAMRAGVPWLRSWPANFPSLDEQTIAIAQEDVLVHRITPGAPLLICFADAPAEDEARFDASPDWEALETNGGTVNRILLRDSRQRAWLAGCAGMGDNVDSVAANLRRLITKCDPIGVVCIGQGVGGFAAILLASMIGAEAALVFDPLTILDAVLAASWHDSRYRRVLGNLSIEDSPRDLLPVLKRYRGKTNILCSALAQGSYDAGSHSAVHAQRVAMLPNVSVTALPTEGDALGYAREHGLFARLLGWQAAPDA